MRSGNELYHRVSAQAEAIEAELKSLGRWDSQPLSPQKFENIGAFGSNTMTFEQWIQFVLIPRIQSIVKDRDGFPDESMLAPYAIRYFDGDPDADKIHQLLYELDAMINGEESDDMSELSNTQPPEEKIYLGDSTIPPVMITLADLLPQFDGDPLESQLQTFDSFLSVLSKEVRPSISKLILKAAEKSANPISKQRLEKAAADVARGERAAEPYDHEAAMKKYQEEFAKGYMKGK
jgi:uncharacterized protein YqcC (DUF446 family)